MSELSAVQASTRTTPDRHLIEPVSTTEPPAVAPAITVNLPQLRLTQSAQMTLLDCNQRLLPGAIAAEEPFSLELPIQFTALPAGELPQQIIYRVQCQVRQLTTGAVISLGDMVNNVPISTRSSYTAAFSEMTLQRGIYRLQVLVIVQNFAAVSGLFNVPLLQVI